MTKLKKLLPALIIPIWISLFVFELGTLIFLKDKPSVRRAWERAGVPDIATFPNRDSMLWAPFRPRFIFDQDLKGGDLTTWLQFLPLKDELFRQYFEVDEYGFRNRAGTFDKEIKAVIFGTSNVGGGQLSQEHLVSDILTNKYGIPAYNYALKPMQFFWEDERFQKKPPKYVVILAPGDGIIAGDEVTALQETNKTHEVKKYQSYDQWWKENLGTPYIKFLFNYNNITPWLKYFSTTRYIANDIRRQILNHLFSKEQLSKMYANKTVSYDPDFDVMFMHYEGDNPLLDEKAQANIPQTIIQMKQTRDLLKTRGITLIVIGVPTRISLYHKLYRDLPREKFALVKMEEEMKKNGIEHIELYDLMSNRVRKDKELFYFKQDTHWNVKTEEIITDLLAKKIKRLD